MRWINFSILVLAISTAAALQKQLWGTAPKHDHTEKRADVLSHQHATEYRDRSRTGNGATRSGEGKFGKDSSRVNTVPVKLHDYIDNKSIGHQQYQTAERYRQGGVGFRGRGRRRRLRRRRGQRRRGRRRRTRRIGLKTLPQMVLDTENGTQLGDEFNDQQTANEDEGQKLLAGVEQSSDGKAEEFEITEDSSELHTDSTTPQPLESNRGVLRPRRRSRGYNRRMIRRKHHPTFGRRRRRRKMSLPAMRAPLRTRPRQVQQLELNKDRLRQRRQGGQLGTVKLFGQVRTRKNLKDVRPRDGGLYRGRKPIGGYNLQQSPGRRRRWNRPGSLINGVRDSNNDKPKEISHVNSVIGSSGLLKPGTNSYQQPGTGRIRWENSQQGGSSLARINLYYKVLPKRYGNW